MKWEDSASQHYWEVLQTVKRRKRNHICWGCRASDAERREAFPSVCCVAEAVPAKTRLCSNQGRWDNRGSYQNRDVMKHSMTNQIKYGMILHTGQVQKSPSRCLPSIYKGHIKGPVSKKQQEQIIGVTWKRTDSKRSRTRTWTWI